MAWEMIFFLPSQMLMRCDPVKQQSDPTPVLLKGKKANKLAYKQEKGRKIEREKEKKTDRKKETENKG